MARRNRTRSSVAENLSESKNRAHIHAAVLLGGAGVLLAVVLGWDMFAGTPKTPDKLAHFEGGRVMAACVFYMAYICIVVRVLLVGRGGGSLTRTLLWMPAMLALGLVVAILAVLVLAIGKEGFDVGGFGVVEWLDVEASLDGALTMITPIGIIMVLTPFLIPMDLLLQLPKMLVADVKTGIGSLDGYVQAQKSHESSGKHADVLLVEDDIVCATAVMNFSRNVGLTCHHVTTISDAEEYLHDHLPRIKLIVLDNFVGVDASGHNTTGSQWLMELSETFPPKERSFLVTMISGHTELLGKAADLADLVLQKPWNPRHLATFLIEQGIIQQRG